MKIRNGIRASALLCIASAILALTGCGAGQAVADSTVAAAQWLFTARVKTMNIDLISRAAINPNGQGQSLSTVIRLYQLKNADTFEKLDYAQLQSDDLANLQQDLLAQKNIVLRPDASASISEPMEKGTRYVGVVAFFLNPDADGHWKLAIPIAQWKKTDPVKIEVRGNTLQIQKV